MVSSPPHHRLDRPTLDRLLALADELRRDPPASLVVTGGPKAFLVGVDPAVFIAEQEPFALVAPDEVRAVARGFGSLLRSLASLPCPAVAAVVGPALGGGFELALACDVRVAAPTATFALPEVRLGVLPGGGATQRLPRLLGTGRAKDLVLTGRRISGADAHAWGLVDHLAERSDVLAVARAEARRLAEGDAWRSTRALLDPSLRTGSR